MNDDKDQTNLGTMGWGDRQSKEVLAIMKLLICCDTTRTKEKPVIRSVSAVEYQSRVQ